MNRSIDSFAGLLALVFTGHALADCAATATCDDVTLAHAEASKLAQAGNLRDPLDAYVRAQEDICVANPVAGEAARRVAQRASMRAPQLTRIFSKSPDLLGIAIAYPMHSPKDLARSRYARRRL